MRWLLLLVLIGSTSNVLANQCKSYGYVYYPIEIAKGDWSWNTSSPFKRCERIFGCKRESKIPDVFNVKWHHPQPREVAKLKATAFYKDGIGNSKLLGVYESAKDAPSSSAVTNWFSSLDFSGEKRFKYRAGHHIATNLHFELFYREKECVQFYTEAELEEKKIYDNCVVDLMPEKNPKYSASSVYGLCKRKSQDPSIIDKIKYLY